MDLEVNNYIRFNRSIRNERGRVAYGSGGAGIITRVSKGKKTVKNLKGDVLGKHRVVRVFAGPILGMTTAIVDDGEYEVIGTQETLQGVGYGKLEAQRKSGKDWSHL